MTSERSTDTLTNSATPATIEHKHGLDEWWPMLPERTAETIEPGTEPSERFYRCQKVGCGELIRIAER